MNALFEDAQDVSDVDTFDEFEGVQQALEDMQDRLRDSGCLTEDELDEIENPPDFDGAG